MKERIIDDLKTENLKKGSLILKLKKKIVNALEELDFIKRNLGPFNRELFERKFKQFKNLS